MDKIEKYMKEAYFDTREEAEAHLALAARIKHSMDKTMKAIKREPQSEVHMTELSDQEIRTRQLLLEEAKFKHQRKMDEATLEIRKQELACWAAAQRQQNYPTWQETP